MIEMNPCWIDPARQGLKKICAMEAMNAGAEASHCRGLVAIIEPRAAVHVAGEYAGRDVGDGRDPLAKPNRAQRQDGLRTNVDPGANLAKLRRLLEDLRRDAEASERGRGRQPGEAAADDGNANLAHRPLSGSGAGECYPTGFSPFAYCLKRLT